MTSPLVLAKQLLGILSKDSDRLERIDGYLHGRHADPYMPTTADDEYRLLASRSVTNMCGFLVGIPAQALAVDGFRRGHGGDDETDEVDKHEVGTNAPEWSHWQESRLDARQSAIYRGALGYGHSFTVTELVKGKVRTKGLSALKTSAVFEDAANDETPYAALTVVSWPGESRPGIARLWDSKNEYPVTFPTLDDLTKVRVGAGFSHRAKECPITRFVAAVDLEGRTVGVVEPMIALQDRINQTVFDLLVAQTYASTKVRTVTGMAPPIQRDPETGDPVLDTSGNPIPLPINHNAKRFLFAEDHEAKFGSLDETPLNGFIESIDMSIRHLSAISQTPPHYLLGQIANLSAEALQAAETSLARKVAEFRKVFGESWERVFRLAADLMDNADSADDFEGEVIWRDMESRSLAQASDALGKLAGLLDIPKRGLWHRVPGATQNELEMWREMADAAPDVVMAASLNRAAPVTPAAQPMTISDRVSLR